MSALFSEARALPSPAGLSCSLVPSCQRPQVLRSTASVWGDPFRPHANQRTLLGASLPQSEAGARAASAHQDTRALKTSEVEKPRPGKVT